MNRRGFLTSLGALATTSALPKIPAIPIAHVNPIVLFIANNAIYGKTWRDVRKQQSAYYLPEVDRSGLVYISDKVKVLYSAADGIITTDNARLDS